MSSTALLDRLKDAQTSLTVLGRRQDAGAVKEAAALIQAIVRELDGVGQAALASSAVNINTHLIAAGLKTGDIGD
jgi:hypothetical protein